MEGKEKYTTFKNNIIGVDLGQAQDYTAICVLEQRQPADQPKPLYLVRYLERVALGTPYPVIINHVVRIYNSLCKLADHGSGGGPVLVIDSTGVGRPVFDSFKQADLHPVGISIHGGSTVTREGDIYNVPKRDLAGVLQVLYQNARIKVSSRLKDAQTFNNELLNFKVKINIKTGHDSYEAWREGVHDDLVLSVACAAWYGETTGDPRRFQSMVVSKRRW
ncbi:hypothetical protein ANME2D_00544 [Candidatus Methanoperedens nitroreducens]|uniref:Terminase large subunit gp17-like C-terminal domain-containing protein n=1 Tax=Candidatus Methanoperedens nitratireducens TaxID=1392998 RepID=A0A062V342_9EURY|nr:hypothetical protein [Candidatus Methanoperedens nitroreducens]KCZ73476.1 hypothetical protein ANME2D_00544 [Candidatus Methanoperedens nitroreducens]MDJ1422568.1 hypothetical protein [Candidatus Methanoperedens sp.]